MKVTQVPPRQNNLTTVRVRNADNSYRFSNASIEGSQVNMNKSMQINTLWERKRRTQEKIEAFKEHRLQKQIELIERQ
jgi:TolA-binding protein